VSERVARDVFAHSLTLVALFGELREEAVRVVKPLH
jgi:hypothetical protein